jgi:hypothetical protein
MAVETVVTVVLQPELPPAADDALAQEEVSFTSSSVGGNNDIGRLLQSDNATSIDVVGGVTGSDGDDTSCTDAGGGCCISFRFLSNGDLSVSLVVVRITSIIVSCAITVVAAPAVLLVLSWVIGDRSGSSECIIVVVVAASESG